MTSTDLESAVLERAIGERPSQLKTLERQLLLANHVPGVRVTDTALEEIGAHPGNSAHRLGQDMADLCRAGS